VHKSNYHALRRSSAQPLKPCLEKEQCITLTARSVMTQVVKLSPTVVLAALFHDVIYEPKRHDNEEASARLVAELLGGRGLPAYVSSGRACK
jgi:predicted metal-dependent HD superfamily phosphohydrolase